MSDDAIWMPLYITKYLGDTMHLSTEQHGAYLLLLMHAGKKGGLLPNDDSQLANICKLSAANWRRHRPVLMQFFRETGGGLSQKRLAAEIEKSQRLIATNRENGRKGGRPKKQKPNHTQNKPTGYDSVPENTGFQEPNSKPKPKRNETQPQLQPQNPPENSVPYDDGGTSNGAREVDVTDWCLSDEVTIGLEQEHWIPVEFSKAVFDEFRKFWSGKELLLPTEWDSRFIQRVYEQWKRQTDRRGNTL